MEACTANSKRNSNIWTVSYYQKKLEKRVFYKETDTDNTELSRIWISVTPTPY